MTTQTAEGQAPSKENFADLLDEFVGDGAGFEGRLIKGTVLSIDNDAALIDVGLKVEGRVPLKEFSVPGQPHELKIGDKVEVFIERIENRRGEAVLSRERARREEAWEKLEKAHDKVERVNGVIFGRVKGGFTVDLDGAVAFLPGSQVDIRPVRDIAPLIGTEQPFQILKMDRRRGNIVVSRRAVLEDTRAEQRNELIANLHEGQVLDGIVKNITDYGAFVDLGGVDGLLHVTDIAWRRVNHPNDALQIGQSIKVQVIRFNAETQRISLGMKQLEADPWEGIGAKYPVGAKYTGRVTNITDYGAFVELEPGVEGLVHVSEMSWTKKNVHPGKIVSTSQEVEVMVLDVDSDKRRISLGLKQCLANPWTNFEEQNPEGTVLEGEIKNITEFGLFVELAGEIFGMVHLSDIDWAQPGETAIQNYDKGDKIKVKVISIDIEKERVGLGIKQLDDDPFQVAHGKQGQAVTCTVTGVLDSGVEVEVLDGLSGFVRRSDLARDRNEQRPDRFAVGDKFDAKLTQIERGGRRISLSIKALEVEEEKQAVEEYGSTDSGASLGDILGAAISRKQEQEAGAVPEDNANTPNSSPASEVMAGPAAVGAEEPDDSATPDNGAEPAEDNGDMAESGDEEAKDS
ncbi:MAG: 30S ribosomal protein S1 [Rhodospirillaceae bacterium]|nr:30S ribosomal protein S1 [Rhodospirillaceae bacterium]